MHGVRAGSPAARRLLVLAAFLGIVACNGEDRPQAVSEETLTEPARAEALLFSDGTGGLSEADRSSIATALGWSVSDDRRTLVDETCGLPLRHEVSFPDLNGDGQSEVVVDFGNACTSGMAGTSVVLFVRDDLGRYRPSLSVPGLIAEIRPPGKLGFAGLLIGGPGFCFGVWRWTGERYEHVRNEPQAPGGCDWREENPR